MEPGVPAYAEFGDPTGAPVILFHGLPSCRLQAQPIADFARQAGVRLISYDRPGMGNTRFVRARRIIDEPARIAVLAGHLALDRFSVLAGSGGTAYGLATVRDLSDRINRTALFSVLPDVSTPEITRDLRASTQKLFAFARRGLLPLLYPMVFLFRLRIRQPGAIETFLTRFPPTDQEALRHMDSLDWLLFEPFRQGIRGPAWDTRLLASPWGFAPGELLFPRDRIRLWHGDQDRVTPPALGTHLANQLGVEQTTCPGAGHYLGDFAIWREMLGWLAKGTP